MSENMLFCLGDSDKNKGEGYQKNNRIFNHDVTKTEFQEVKNSLPLIKIPLCRWINKENMTAKEKYERSNWEQIGGYLKILSYEQAWQEWWTENNWVIKNKILNLPYFDKDIFTQITGIKKIT